MYLHVRIWFLFDCWCFEFELEFIVYMYADFNNAKGKWAQITGMFTWYPTDDIILWQLNIYAINKHTYLVDKDSLPNRMMISIAKILKQKQNIAICLLTENYLLFDLHSVEALCIGFCVVVSCLLDLTA